MIVDPKTGRIAYHSIRFEEDGGTSFVQYGFDGEVLYKTMRTPPPVLPPCRKTLLDLLFTDI